MRLVVFILACLALTGCDRKTFIGKFVPPEDDARARQFIESVRTGDYGAAQAMVTSSVPYDKAQQAIEKFHAALSGEKPLDIKVVDFRFTKTFTASHTVSYDSLTYQIHLPNRWLVCNVVVGRSEGNSQITAFHYQAVPDSLDHINALTFKDKSPAHYIAAALCVLIPSFILYALVVCIRSPVRRKWLWIIFMLFGFVQFHFNWTTGLVQVQILSISLFGAGAFSSGMSGPWILTWSLPVGALIFLLRRRKLMAESLGPPIRR